MHLMDSFDLESLITRYTDQNSSLFYLINAFQLRIWHHEKIIQSSWYSFVHLLNNKIHIRFISVFNADWLEGNHKHETKNKPSYPIWERKKIRVKCLLKIQRLKKKKRKNTKVKCIIYYGTFRKSAWEIMGRK